MQQLTVKKIFDNKKWNVEESSFFKNAYGRAYAQFLKIKEGEDGEINSKLYLDLLNLYSVYNEKDYLPLIDKSLEKIDSIFENREVKRILFIPLIQKTNTNDENTESKYFAELNSSSFLLYHRKSGNIQSIMKKRKVKIEFIKNLNLLKDDNYLKKRLLLANGPDRKEVIILLDDFSGSGNSVIDTLTILNSISDGLIEKTIVSLLFATNDAITKIKEKYGCLGVFSEVNVLKLNELYNEEDFEDVKIRLENISIILGIKKKVLGYNEDGCLVSFMRTPNNTITIFSDSKKGVFPREN